MPATGAGPFYTPLLADVLTTLLFLFAAVPTVFFLTPCAAALGLTCAAAAFLAAGDAPLFSDAATAATIEYLA